jgi:hypothetical protein
LLQINRWFNLAFSIICFHSYRLVKNLFVSYIYDIPREINNFYVSKCRVERQKTEKIKKDDLLIDYQDFNCCAIPTEK